MNSVKIQARIAGYTWALQRGEAPDDLDIDHAFEYWFLTQRIVASDRTKYEIGESFSIGAWDTHRPYMDLEEIIEGEEYIGMDEAADIKGKNRLIISRILNSDEREKIFPGAVRIGKSKRAYWMIPRSEVEAWKPRKRGKPKK